MEYRRVKAFLLASTLGAGSLILPFTAVGGATQDQPATLPALQVVLLVDQSGSLSDSAVVAEKEAARTIAASVLGSGSEVSVVGFASAEKPGQSAVDAVCQSIQLDAPQQRDRLAKCIGDLRKRKDEEGDGTDHAAALEQALTYASSAKQEKKIVFLLTDGKLDVSASDSWGDTPERRNAAAAARAQQLLGDLDRAGAQVWPLGFGDVDVAALRGFAKGKSCTPSAPDPKEQVVPNLEELTTAVARAFSSASCAEIKPPVIDTLGENSSVVLDVDIPAVASDASIVVYKRHQGVRVEYQAPNSDKPAPAAGGSRFEIAGSSTETESVRISDPEPGRWKVRLSASGIPAQQVAATVIYQAAVKATITASPPQPEAGQTVEVSMQIRARGRAVIDPGTLKGLTFVTTMTGNLPEQKATLSDPDGDGTFAGKFTLPDNASGDLLFTGQVTGIGVGGDTRTYPTKVLKGAAPVQAQILFDANSGPVAPGGTVTGSVTVANNSGQSAQLRLNLDGLTDGTTMTVEPATVQAAPGTSKTTFSVKVGLDARIGPSAATVQLIDSSNAVVDNRLLAIEVAPEPGIWQKFYWVWITLAVLLLVGVLWLLARLRARREAAKTRGLLAQLWQGGFPTSELMPRDPDSKLFRFILHNDFTGLQLQHAGPDETTAYEVRRLAGRVTLVPPGQQPVQLAIGERHDIGQDLAIAFADERGATGGLAAGPPADPFVLSTADQSGDLYHRSSAVPTQSPPTNPFDSGPTGEGRHATDRDSYVDPNNPFA
ncbi:hypothetical protein Lesp02_02010 [Lentzea sp. NBRC 105346]|uniref:vWA domain-containing protein n=1 Tax=Lentzea sp. NBRC 105346 TaxID=3032205 RepID=UPI0024A385D3|nr:vWA domain-containing protein [Lentzea sp. NBRC 105346]GLZ28011.1 hypothetical protein Lesp02_02010 [Lentzea sp. NBRC 105346]